MDGTTSGNSTRRFETGPDVAEQAIQHQELTVYACSICFQTATHPVASTCGHLFCWKCLFAWLQGHPRPCPVCRTNLIQGVNIIPLFTFTRTDVDECAAGAPQCNSVNAATIPQRPPPPSPDQLLGPIPFPSPVGVGRNTVDDVTPSIFQEEIEDVIDLTVHFEISRERVDSMEQTVQDLIHWCVMLREENGRMDRRINRMNRRHARQIAAIHRQYAEEIDRMRHIHSHGRV